jgi:hypothetical protein
MPFTGNATLDIVIITIVAAIALYAIGRDATNLEGDDNADDS